MGGCGPPREEGGGGGDGGDREHHRLLVLLGVYTRARLADRHGYRVPRKVSLRRVREVSGLPAAYVEELVEELVEEGYLEYRRDNRVGLLRLLGRTVRAPAAKTTFVSLTESGFDYPGLGSACELLLGNRMRREEVVHHLTMPHRFMEDLRSEDAERQGYAWSMAACIGMCTIVSLVGGVALVLEVVI